jgi:hypothetical protein
VAYASRRFSELSCRDIDRRCAPAAVKRTTSRRSDLYEHRSMHRISKHELWPGHGRRFEQWQWCCRHVDNRCRRERNFDKRYRCQRGFYDEQLLFSYRIVARAVWCKPAAIADGGRRASTAALVVHTFVRSTTVGRLGGDGKRCRQHCGIWRDTKSTRLDWHMKPLRVQSAMAQCWN